MPNWSAISNSPSGTTGSSTGCYVWVGPADSDWLTAGNWSGVPAFTNDAAGICDVIAGGTPKITTSNASFLGRLNLNSGTVLDQGGGLGTATIGSLHLNGGTVNMGGASSINVTGGISMDADSTLTALGSNNNSLTAVFSGSGNLTITNNQPNTRQLAMNIGDSSGYTGSWTLDGTGLYSITGDLGTTTVHANSTNGVNYVCSNGAVNWILNGTMVSFGSQTNTQNGQLTVLTDSTIRSFVDYYGKTTTLNSKVTGAAKVSFLSSNNKSSDEVNLIINNGTNDYTGGTEIKGYQTRAAVAHALGTGPVQVDAGSTLVAAVSDVMSSAANLYLDYNSGMGTYGKLNLASGTTTTTSNAFIGGTGGWANPVGYTQLAPGTYTSTDLPDYITGTGSLVVPVSDTTAPSAVSDLAAGNPTETSLTLTWTAAGDDGSTGTASTYDIRYSTSSITESNWDAATQVTGEPAPAVAGTSQSMTVSGLSTGTTYYFAIKTADETPNWSAISNIASGTTASGSYTWVGPTDGDWLTASNWSGSPSFANEADDVCDINSGGTAKITTSNASFLGQLNLNSGAVLNQGGILGTSTIGSLHLNGGTVNMGGASGISVTGGISMDADSALTALGSSNNTLIAVFSGSGDLTITNNQPNTRQSVYECRRQFRLQRQLDARWGRLLFDQRQSGHDDRPCQLHQRCRLQLHERCRQLDPGRHDAFVRVADQHPERADHRPGRFHYPLVRRLLRQDDDHQWKGYRCCQSQLPEY